VRRVVLLAGLALLATAAHADAKPPTGRGGRPAGRPVRVAPPLPMLPSVARVRVEAARDHVVLTEEVDLPRGDWTTGGLELYVAFGAPGTPTAIDARLVAAPAGALEVRPEDAGDAVTLDPAIRRTVSSQMLLGRPTMAGVVVHVKDADLRRAYATSDLAALRIRSLLVPPAVDAAGARGIVVRLGVGGGLPLTLSHVQVVSAEPQPWITKADATLCGPEADDWPLSVALSPKPADPPPVQGRPPLAPVAALRHASDDLCIRWWAPP
jgi:hypothetical protein